jgi:hypothetical protein
MKKYLLIIAGILFFWNLGFSETTSRNGTITVSVPTQLNLVVSDGLIQFAYNRANPVIGLPPTNVTDNSAITVKANVNWKINVSTGGETQLKELHSNNTIEASIFEYYITDVTGIITNGGVGVVHKLLPERAPLIEGSKNADFTIYWRPENAAFVGNIPAGKYSIGISYILSEN